MACSHDRGEATRRSEHELEMYLSIIFKIRLNRHFNSICYFRNKFKNSQDKKNLLQVIADVFFFTKTSRWLSLLKSHA